MAKNTGGEVNFKTNGSSIPTAKAHESAHCSNNRTQPTVGRVEVGPLKEECWSTFSGG